MTLKFKTEIICSLLMATFLYAALTKVLEFEKFRTQLGQSPLLTAFAEWVAWLVPTTELVFSAMLLIPRCRLVALYASLSLMVMFTGYIIAILNFSEFIPCSCGGIFEKLSWNAHLIFNIGLVLLSIAGILMESKNRSEEIRALST